MAGREFGPPPSVITEFNQVWRNWLNLVFQKIYKRTYTITLQVYNSVDHGSLPMARSIINALPVCLADDTTNEFQYLAFSLPIDWVPGTDLSLYLYFANAATQTGVKTVVTQIVYSARLEGELLTGGAVALTDTTSLPSGVAANNYHKSGLFTIPASALTLGDTIYFSLGRTATSDTCVGDVGYQNIIIEYTGYINHE